MELSIVHGDITEVKADAIVNAANVYLAPGGGVCGAIYAKAGPELHKWSDRQREIHAGQARMSHSYNMTNCDHIIHTVGPVYNYEMPQFNKPLLASAYYSALQYGIDRNLQSIAFPAISTGIYGYPMDEALEVVKDVLIQTNYEGKIILVCYSDSDYYKYREKIKPKNIRFSRAWLRLCLSLKL